MVSVIDRKGNKVFVTICDDCGENKGGYYCRVYTDYELDEMIEQVIALSNYSNFFQK